MKPEKLVISETDPSLGINTIAGGIAGILELCIMYPIDTVKTRMQSLDKKQKGVYYVLKEMIKEEGAFRPLRGMGIIAATAGPAHGAYFASYEFVKHHVFHQTSESITLASATAAVVATTLHDLLVNPAEVIKQRMQMEHSPYKSIVDCALKTYRNEGLFAFYKSFSAQLLMNIPFQVVQFVTYELFKGFVDPKQSLLIYFINGGVAGGVAAAVTTPLDVCKTLLNTQEHQTKNLLGAIKMIYKVSGPRGFFKGTTARIIHQAPSIGLCWGIYESVKYLLYAIR